MSHDTFIGRHGLVRYGPRLGDRYPRSRQCEIGLCERARREWLALAETGLARFAEVSAAIAEVSDVKAWTLARKAGAGPGRRERERELRRLRDRIRSLAAERDHLAVAVPVYERIVRDGQDVSEPGPLVFDHCHDHGWVRGLVCASCNNRMSYADSGQDAEPALMDHWRKCPECRGSRDES